MTRKMHRLILRYGTSVLTMFTMLVFSYIVLNCLVYEYSASSSDIFRHEDIQRKSLWFPMRVDRDEDEDFVAQSAALKEPMFILVLANSGRSGSTVLGELLAEDKSTVFFFEPLFVFNLSPILKNGSVVSKFLEGIFKCNYTDEFGEWFRYYILFRDFYHPTVRECRKAANQTECIKNIDFRGLCYNATVRIIKVIRSPMDSIRNLIGNPSLNMKILHLQRDPRASMSSMFFMGWNPIPKLVCGEMLNNTLAYNDLVKKYPMRINQVSFEELCRYPRKTTSKIYDFLWNNATLPEPIEQYIKSHMKPEKNLNDTMSTEKQSKNETQAWRWEINETLFFDSEKEYTCQKSIEMYGHSLFGTVEKLRDPKIPVKLN